MPKVQENQPILPNQNFSGCVCSTSTPARTPLNENQPMGCVGLVKCILLVVNVAFAVTGKVIPTTIMIGETPILINKKYEPQSENLTAYAMANDMFGCDCREGFYYQGR